MVNNKTVATWQPVGSMDEYKLSHQIIYVIFATVTTKFSVIVFALVIALSVYPVFPL